MKKTDFLQIVGEGEEYAPVAGILQGGYGFAGYFNSSLNQSMDDSCVIINARLADLRGAGEGSGKPRIADFDQFVEDIVLTSYLPQQAPEEPRSDFYGKSIPLVAIPYDQVAVIYPVGQIGKMMQELQREQKKVPSFLDLDDKSIVLKILRTKLW